MKMKQKSGRILMLMLILMVFYASNRVTRSLDIVENEKCGRNVVLSYGEHPYRMYLHPRGSDSIISDSIFTGSHSGKYFESNIRDWMTDAIQTEKGVDILDIGANIGLHTLHFASLGHLVHAFEPFEANLKLLQCSINANAFENIKVLPFGLSSHATSACIKVPSPHNQGSAAIWETTDDCPNRIQLKRLDLFLVDQNIRPFLVKVDCEGYELEALITSFKYFKAHPPAHFFVEFAPRMMKRIGSDPIKLLDYFWDLGYEIEQIRDGATIHDPRVLLKRHSPQIDAFLKESRTDIHAYFKA